MNLSRSLQPATGDFLITNIVTAVAETRGVDPLDLPPLYDAINSDALERMFSSPITPAPPSPSHVRFTYEGCEVVVHTDGEVSVTPVEESDTVTSGTRGLQRDRDEQQAAAE